ncbi:MAG: transglycosylase family protein, partial [Thermoleophilia bacterium]
RRQYLRASRLAVTLGMTRPAPPRIPAGRAAQLRGAARWRAIADWLAARSEKIRPAERPMRDRVPYYDQFMCIARHESGGRWDVSTGNGYYGGLQMDVGFQQTYAPGLYRTKGTADHWTAEEQIRAAGRAVASRGFTPWPNTARMCGLL